jgi:hypothetical protein
MNFRELRKAEVRRIPLLGTGVKIDSAAAHFHGFGVARQGPWFTSVNRDTGKIPREARRYKAGSIYESTSELIRERISTVKPISRTTQVALSHRLPRLGVTGRHPILSTTRRDTLAASLHYFRVAGDEHAITVLVILKVLLKLLLGVNLLLGEKGDDTTISDTTTDTAASAMNAASAKNSRRIIAALPPSVEDPRTPR